MAATILVDGNGIANHYHHATKLTVGEFQTQAIFGFVKIMRDVAYSYPLHDLIVLWDGESSFRHELLPTYKESRRHAEATDPEKARERGAYRAQVPFITKSMQTLGVRQIKCHNLEADDLGGYFATRLSAAGQNVLLITGDTDWLQLVNERTTWLDPRGQNGKRVSLANFFSMTGYQTPKEYLQGKCLIGDPTDDIPPVGGIGAKGAPEFMAQFRSVPEFWRRCDTGEFVPTKKAHIGLWKGEARENFKRNLKLISLLNVPKPDPQTLNIDNGSYNADAFKAICERLVFASLLRDFDNFVAPFQKQWAGRVAKRAA
jgi:5'-3' exonuclease